MEMEKLKEHTKKLNQFVKWSKNNRDIIEYDRIIKDIIHRRTKQK